MARPSRSRLTALGARGDRRETDLGPAVRPVHQQLSRSLMPQRTTWAVGRGRNGRLQESSRKPLVLLNEVRLGPLELPGVIEGTRLLEGFTRFRVRTQHVLVTRPCDRLYDGQAARSDDLVQIVSCVPGPQLDHNLSGRQHPCSRDWVVEDGRDERDSSL